MGLRAYIGSALEAISCKQVTTAIKILRSEAVLHKIPMITRLLCPPVTRSCCRLLPHQRLQASRRPG
jgi:hypothetical protein